MDVNSPLSVFCCYSDSPKDVSLFDELEKHLANLKNSRLIDLWHLRKISPGENIEAEVAFRIATADIVLAIQSSDFLSSEFCSRQLALALSLHYQQQLCLIPVLFRTSDWENSPVFQLEPLPHSRKAVAWYKGDERDLVFLDIVRGIRSIVERLYPLPRRKNYFPAEGHSFSVVSNIRNLSPEDFRRIGRFLPASGLAVSGKYRIHKSSSNIGNIVLYHSPLGIPYCTPVSVSIDTADCAPKNITQLVTINLHYGGVMLRAHVIDANVPYEVAGNLTIQY
jgi:TIR domain